MSRWRFDGKRRVRNNPRPPKSLRHSTARPVAPGPITTSPSYSPPERLGHSRVLGRRLVLRWDCSRGQSGPRVPSAVSGRGIVTRRVRHAAVVAWRGNRKAWPPCRSPLEPGGVALDKPEPKQSCLPGFCLSTARVGCLWHSKFVPPKSAPFINRSIGWSWQRRVPARRTSPFSTPGTADKARPTPTQRVVRYERQGRFRWLGRLRGQEPKSWPQELAGGRTD